MMRHYEIVLLIHPNQSDQVSQMVERYKVLLSEGEGQLHRLEDWGRRRLAYPIQKLYKAHYVLMNIECSQSVLSELNNAFQFNDMILRTFILRRKTAIQVQSPILAAAASSENKVVATPAKAVTEEVESQASQESSSPMAEGA